MKLALIPFLICASCLHAMPAQVIIVRHGEKDVETFNLTLQGFERAGALAHYLTETPDLIQFGPPSALFASRPVQRSDEFTDRCIQSLIPTGTLLNLPIHTPFGPPANADLANFILHNSRYDGKNVVICWHHTSIALLISAFGYNPPPIILPVYPPRFDLTFIMTFPAPVPAVDAPVQCQSLMWGDPPDVSPAFSCP
jgi:hypothetical protein